MKKQTKTNQPPEALTEEELEEANGEELPERAAMSVIREPGPQPLPIPFDTDPRVTVIDDPAGR
jgi:hypothetical protein